MSTQDKPEDGMTPLPDSEIRRIAETLGLDEEGISNYNTWGLGYRKDAEGRYSIPNLPLNVVPFARAIEVRVAKECMKAVTDAGPKDGPLRLVTDGFVAAIKRRLNLE